jgi:hypothetical protein
MNIKNSNLLDSKNSNNLTISNNNYNPNKKYEVSNINKAKKDKAFVFYRPKTTNNNNKK